MSAKRQKLNEDTLQTGPLPHDSEDDPVPPAYSRFIHLMRRLSGEEKGDYVDVRRLRENKAELGLAEGQSLNKSRDGIVKLKNGERECRLKRVWLKAERTPSPVVTRTAHRHPAEETFDIDLDALPAQYRSLIRCLRDRGGGGNTWTPRESIEANTYVARAAEKGGFPSIRRYLDAAEDDQVIEVDRSRSERSLRLRPLFCRIPGDVLPVAFKLLILRLYELLGDDIGGWCHVEDLNSHGMLGASFNLTGRVDISGYLANAHYAGIVEVNGALADDSHVRFTAPWRMFLQSNRLDHKPDFSAMPAIDPFKALVEQIYSLGGGRGRYVDTRMIVKDQSIKDSFCLARVFKLMSYLDVADQSGVIELSEDQDGNPQLSLLPDWWQSEADFAPTPRETPSGYGPLVQLLQGHEGGAAFVPQASLYSALGKARDSLAVKAGIAVRPGFDAFAAYLSHGETLGVLERSEREGIRLAPAFRQADRFLDSLLTVWAH